MRNTNRKKILIYLAVIGLLVFLYAFNLLGPLNKVIYNILNPIFSGFQSVSSNIRLTYNEQTDKIDLREHIKELENQVNQLTEENARLKILENENGILREHLGFLVKNEYNYVMSNVISRGDAVETSGMEETIIIDKGAKDGVYPGLAIVSGQGIIIGKVAEVKENISQVNLTNSNKCKLAATILNEDKTNGITEGELGLIIKMEFIPQEEEVNIGDIIVTSGLEQAIPRGLVIGKVTQAEKENNEIWQFATLEPLIKAQDLVIVSVLIP